MADLDRIRLKDVRAILQLLGECCELGGDHGLWRSHMLEGLRQITGAKVALYMLIDSANTHTEEVKDALDAGFLDANERSLWGHYQKHKAHLDDPFHLRFFGNNATLLRTHRLGSVVDGQTWYRSRHYNEYVRACRLDDRITSALRLQGNGGNTQQVLVLHRAATDGKYSRRMQQVVHLFHHEINNRLGRQLAFENDEQNALPPRLQQVLICLLEGDREKQIAARLAISPSTVNHHVQRLYRHFDVHSRAELMTRCPIIKHPHRLSGQKRTGLKNTDS